jgi:hypothetical protein
MSIAWSFKIFFKIKIYKLITTSTFNEIIILDVGVKQLQQFEKQTTSIMWKY